MSNSIWKKPDQKPELNKTIVAKIAQTGFCVDYKTIKGMETLPNFEKWCYLDDLIAQADKAERLQKAVDFAIRGLEKVHRANSCITKESQIAYEYLKEIKQLIKGE